MYITDIYKKLLNIDCIQQQPHASPTARKEDQSAMSS